jgi:hypothetical protein
LAAFLLEDTGDAFFSVVDVLDGGVDGIGSVLVEVLQVL